MSLILKQGKKLFDLGLAVHWLRPRDKVPVKSNWSGDQKDSWRVLEREFQKGYNIGARLGQLSQFEDGTYLAILDVDLKSEDPEHKKLAVAWLKKNFGDLFGNTVEVLSGRGNGSRHIWMRVKEPLSSQKLYSSPIEVEVYMPSAKANAKQIKLLGEEKVKKGIRLRPAFEIDFMCVGKQVALPPSIHPDSGKEYKWGQKFGDSFSYEDVKLMDMEKKLLTITTNKSEFKKENRNDDKMHGWKAVEVDHLDVELKLSEKLGLMLYSGEDVEDNSSACLSVSMGLVKAGFSDDEIMSILTDKDDTYLGETAYRHAQTENRARAARWIRDYCLAKARREVDAKHVFDDDVEVFNNFLPVEEAEKQMGELNSLIHWTSRLERTANGDKPKTSLKNTILVLTNAVDKKVFLYDEFFGRDIYGCDTPWEGKKGEAITDADVIAIKIWIAQHHAFEPNVNTIHEAVAGIGRDNKFHPVRSYFESLEWDGEDRIQNAFKNFFNAEGPETYLGEVSRLFFIAAVARIMSPGIKFDHMVIFEGKQGKGKSSFGSILASQAWFSDTVLNFNDKDAVMNIQGAWIYEIGELSSMKRSEIEVTKAFITRQVDKIRPPYGRRMLEMPRQTVFFGTTNAGHYLTDKTGNRRFWPVIVDQLDFEKLKSERDQLWAEAYFIWQNIGAKLFLSDEASKELEGVQADKIAEDEEDVMQEKLEKFMEEELMEGEFDFSQFKLSQLFEIGGPWEDEKQTSWNLRKASDILKRLSFIKKRSKSDRFWSLKA